MNHSKGELAILERLHHKRRSVMLQGFQLADAKGEREPKLCRPLPKPTVWFFYGSLMDPSTLQSVLSLAERPILRPAQMEGYHLRMWGPYPALIDARPLLTVPGAVFEAGEHHQYEDLSAKLQAYEGANYKCRTCLVEILGREEEGAVKANTFEWIGDAAELRDGSFDLKDYQMKRLEMEMARTSQKSER